VNYPRILIAAIVATVVDAAYGIVVWASVLSKEFARYPHIYRAASDTSGFALMFAGILVAMCIASWIYANGYEGRGAMEAVRFGIAMGLMMAAYISATDFGTMAIGKKMALTYLVGEFGEWFVAGVAIGLVYKPAAPAAKRAAGV